MERWGGDFSLPRFRAKLANKNLLHPDVEPGYEELYRPELGGRTIVKRSNTASPGMGFSPELSRSRFSGLAASNLDSPFRSSTTALGVSRAGLAEVGRSSMQQPSLTSSSSAPLLGLRRCEVGPARPPKPQPVPAPPPSSVEDRKEWQKQRDVEAASRKLWVAVHGSEGYLRQELAAFGADPKVHFENIAKISPGGVKKALKMGAQIDWQNDEWDGATLLIKVVRQGSQELTQYLLAMGADPTICDSSGRNVLHWAAIGGQVPIVMEFLTPGRLPTEMMATCIDEEDEGGDTPIHLSSFYGHLAVTRLLVRAQADPGQQNGGGFTPLELAESRRNWLVAQYLNDFRQQDADVEDGKKVAGSPPNYRQDTNISLYGCQANRDRVEALRNLAAETKKK